VYKSDGQIWPLPDLKINYSIFGWNP